MRGVLVRIWHLNQVLRQVSPPDEWYYCPARLYTELIVLEVGRPIATRDGVAARCPSFSSHMIVKVIHAG